VSADVANKRPNPWEFFRKEQRNQSQKDSQFFRKEPKTTKHSGFPNGTKDNETVRFSLRNQKQQDSQDSRNVDNRTAKTRIAK